MPADISEPDVVFGADKSQLDIAVAAEPDIQDYSNENYAADVPVTLRLLFLGTVQSTHASRDSFLDNAFGQTETTNITAISPVENLESFLDFNYFNDNTITGADGSANGSAAYIENQGHSGSTRSKDDGTSCHTQTVPNSSLPSFNALSTQIDAADVVLVVEVLQSGSWVVTLNHGFTPARWVSRGGQPLLTIENAAIPACFAAAASCESLPVQYLVTSRLNQIHLGDVRQSRGGADESVLLCKLLGLAARFTKH